MIVYCRMGRYPDVQLLDVHATFVGAVVAVDKSMNADDKYKQWDGEYYYSVKVGELEEWVEAHQVEE